MIVAVLVLVTVPFVLRGCIASTDSPAAAEGGQPPPSPARVNPAGPSLAASSVAAADKVAASGGWFLGAAVLDRDTGEVVAGVRGNEPDYAASLSKLLVVIDVLEQRRAGSVVLTESDLSVMRRALGPSDDGAMNGLWVRFDGLGAGGRMSRLLGLTATTPPRDPSKWAEMMTSAVDVLRMWRHVLSDIPDADRELVVSASTGPPPATDGFDQEFGLFDDEVGAGPAVAKQGWLCCFRGLYTLHSAGLPDPGARYVIALLSRQPRAGGWEGARERLSTAAVVAVRALT